MVTQYEVVDNFFPSDIFNELYGILLFSPPAGNFGTISPQWQYTPNVNYGVEVDDVFDINLPVEQASTKLKDKITKEGNDWRLFYLTHMVYIQTQGILSPLYKKILPPFYENKTTEIYIKALIRIKINMNPNHPIIKEHGMHTDFDFSHKGAIFSINTCDGYTKLEDGTKIDSVANRMLFFDASRPHTSSTCTDQAVRMNINFNYL